ncbi:MAG: response regulator [Bryobacteraceae bacterium]
MEKELQVLVVDSLEDSAATEKMLADEDQVFHSRSAASLLEALNVLAERGFDIIVSELNLPDSQGLATFEALRLHTRDIPIVVMTTAANEQLAFSAVEHGAQDYLIKGRVTTAALIRVLRYAVARHKGIHRGSGESQSVGRTIGVLGAKGGVGATTVAAHLALGLREETVREQAARVPAAPERADPKVLLIDLDANSSSTSFLFQTKPEFTLADAATNLHRLDREFWSGIVSETGCGVDLLNPPGSRGYTEMPPAERVRHVVRFARNLYSLVVVDLGAPSVLALEVIQEVQNVVLVVTPLLMEMLEARRALAKLTEIGLTGDRIHLVWNRATRQQAGAIRLFEKAIGRSAARMIADCSAEIESKFSDGRFLDSSLPLRKETAQLAAHLLGRDAARAPRSLVAFLANVAPRRHKTAQTPVPG